MSGKYSEPLHSDNITETCHGIVNIYRRCAGNVSVSLTLLTYITFLINHDYNSLSKDFLFNQY